MVASKLKELTEMSRFMYAHMVEEIADQQNISIIRVIKTKWSAVSEKAKVKYILLLEEKALIM